MAMRLKRQRALVRAIKALYDEHDHAEGALVMSTRRNGGETVKLWEYHDNLEREIVWLESQLPQSVVERLKRGEI